MNKLDAFVLGILLMSALLFILDKWIGQRNRRPYVINAGELVVLQADGLVRRATVVDESILGIAMEDGTVLISGSAKVSSQFIEKGEEDD